MQNDPQTRHVPLRTACQMNTDPYERMQVLAEMTLNAPPTAQQDLLNEVMRAVRQIRRPQVTMDHFAFYRMEQQDTAARERALAQEYCLALRVLSGDAQPTTAPGMQALARLHALLTCEQIQTIRKKAQDLQMEGDYA